MHAGVAQCVSRIVQAIMMDNNTVMPLSMMSSECVSPSLIWHA